MTPSLNARSDRSRGHGAPSAPEGEASVAAEAERERRAPSELPKGRIGATVRRRATPDQLPLWRDVLALEEMLRPRAYAEMRAQRRVANPWKVATLLLATCAGVAYWAVAIHRQDEVQTLATVGRVTWNVPPLPDYVTPERISEAWVPITVALAIGVVLALIGIVLPATRRFTLRHPVAPVVVGAAAYLGVLQLLLVR